MQLYRANAVCFYTVHLLCAMKLCKCCVLLYCAHVVCNETVQRAVCAIMYNAQRVVCAQYRKFPFGIIFENFSEILPRQH